MTYFQIQNGCQIYSLKWQKWVPCSQSMSFEFRIVTIYWLESKTVFFGKTRHISWVISLKIKNGYHISSWKWHGCIPRPHECTFCIFICVSKLIRSRDRHFPSYQDHSRGHLEYLKVPKGESSTPTWIFSPRPYGWIISREKNFIREVEVRLKKGLQLLDDFPSIFCHTILRHTPQFTRYTLETVPIALIWTHILRHTQAILGNSVYL